MVGPRTNHDLQQLGTAGKVTFQPEFDSRTIGVTKEKMGTPSHIVHGLVEPRQSSGTAMSTGATEPRGEWRTPLWNGEELDEGRDNPRLPR